MEQKTQKLYLKDPTPTVPQTTEIRLVGKEQNVGDGKYYNFRRTRWELHQAERQAMRERQKNRWLRLENQKLKELILGLLLLGGLSFLVSAAFSTLRVHGII